MLNIIYDNNTLYATFHLQNVLSQLDELLSLYQPIHL